MRLGQEEGSVYIDTGEVSTDSDWSSKLTASLITDISSQITSLIKEINLARIQGDTARADYLTGRKKLLESQSEGAYQPSSPLGLGIPKSYLLIGGLLLFGVMMMGIMKK